METKEQNELEGSKKIRVITPVGFYEVFCDRAFVEFVVGNQVRRYRFDGETNSLILDADWHKDTD